MLQNTFSVAQPLKTKSFKPQQYGIARSKVVVFCKQEEQDDKTVPSGKVMREFNEESGETTVRDKSALSPEQKEVLQDQYYGAKPPRVSNAMEEKMRQEYLGLGGSPNQKMGANWFLYIIVGISALAFAAKFTGAI